MRITYDHEANAAYVDLSLDGIATGQAARQQEAIETLGGRGELILDYDVDGRLLGMEILHADEVLPAPVLAAALPPG